MSSNSKFTTVEEFTAEVLRLDACIQTGVANGNITDVMTINKNNLVKVMSDIKATSSAQKSLFMWNVITDYYKAIKSPDFNSVQFCDRHKKVLKAFTEKKPQGYENGSGSGTSSAITIQEHTGGAKDHETDVGGLREEGIAEFASDVGKDAHMGPAAGLGCLQEISEGGVEELGLVLRSRGKVGAPSESGIDHTFPKVNLPEVKRGPGPAKRRIRAMQVGPRIFRNAPVEQYMAEEREAEELKKSKAAMEPRSSTATLAQEKASPGPGPKRMSETSSSDTQSPKKHDKFDVDAKDSNQKRRKRKHEETPEDESQKTTRDGPAPLPGPSGYVFEDPCDSCREAEVECEQTVSGSACLRCSRKHGRCTLTTEDGKLVKRIRSKGKIFLKVESRTSKQTGKKGKKGNMDMNLIPAVSIPRQPSAMIAPNPKSNSKVRKSTNFKVTDSVDENQPPRKKTRQNDKSQENEVIEIDSDSPPKTTRKNAKPSDKGKEQEQEVIEIESDSPEPDSNDEALDRKSVRKAYHNYPKLLSRVGELEDTVADLKAYIVKMTEEANDVRARSREWRTYAIDHANMINIVTRHIRTMHPDLVPTRTHNAQTSVVPQEVKVPPQTRTSASETSRWVGAPPPAVAFCAPGPVPSAASGTERAATAGYPTIFHVTQPPPHPSLSSPIPPATSPAPIPTTRPEPTIPVAPPTTISIPETPRILTPAPETASLVDVPVRDGNVQIGEGLIEEAPANLRLASIPPPVPDEILDESNLKHEY